MKQQPQAAFTSQSDFSKLKMTGPAAQDNTNIELAIYDLMVDGASRTVNQIVRTLAVLGYEASQINSRMVGLLIKKEWFVEGTLSGKTSYKLKKSAKRTIALTTAAKGLESVKASDIVVRSSAEQPFSSASKTPQTVEVTYKRNRSLNVKENTMPQEPIPQPADKPAQHIVLPEDPVKLAIWKVMADHAYYKRNDLAQLLDHINLSTISAALILMEDEGMLEVDRADRKTGFLFRLREGVAAPEGGLPYNPRDRTPKAAAPQPELPLENQIMQPEIPEGQEKSAAQILGDAIGAALQPTNPSVPAEEAVKIDDSGNINSVPMQPKEVAPLIAVGGITIKGVVFSYKEAREVLRELRTFGFGSESFFAASPIASYVKMERRYTISGVDFTAAELNDLAWSLGAELE